MGDKQPIEKAVPEPDRIDRPLDGDSTAKRQSIAVAIIVAVCATLVVAMVFSMADRTRAVVTDVNVVHGIDLASSLVDRITHGIGAAALLSTTDSDQARERLADVADDLVIAEAIVGSGTAPDIAELSDFVTTASQATEGIQAEQTPPTIDAQLDLVAEQSDVLTGRYEEMTGERLESIERADRLLSRFGALGGGAVAFVIPVLAIYLHLRLRDGEQRAHNATITYQWRLTTTERRLRRILDRLASGLTLLELDPAAGRRQLRATLTEGKIEQGQLLLKPESVDLSQVVDEEPELPGLPRRSTGLAEARCLVDPATFRAALSTIESTMLEAGANAVDIVLKPAARSGSAELFLAADGAQPASVSDPRLAGAVPVIRTLLSSGGLDHTIDETGSTWTLLLPMDPADPTVNTDSSSADTTRSDDPIGSAAALEVAADHT